LLPPSAHPLSVHHPPWGSGPPWEKSLLVHSFQECLTHDGQTPGTGSRAGGGRHRQEVLQAWATQVLPGTHKDLPVWAPKPQQQEAECVTRTGVRLGQLSPCPDSHRLWTGHLLTQLRGARWWLLPPHLKSYHMALHPLKGACGPQIRGLSDLHPMPTSEAYRQRCRGRYKMA
jgi:hypothetical protein